MKIAETVPIHRYQDGEFSELDDLMVNEMIFYLKVNNEIYRGFFCSPAELYEMVVGHLYCQRRIFSLSDIESADVSYERCCADVILKDGISENRILPKADDTVRFDIAMLMKNQIRFYEDSVLQKATAGVHRCAICDNTGILLACEDVSRHNAFDKVIGKALIEGVSIHDKYMITSGRVPIDMMRKATAIAIPMIVSRTTPTIASVREARAANVTLIGFSKGNRFNVYTGIERLSQ